MSKIALPGGNGKNKNHLIGRLRIGDLNKLFVDRYGGSRATYVFPDDDSGLEDLKILIHSYAWSNPLAIPRIIKIRAPWADAKAILSEVAADPKKWRAATLGKILNYTGPEHRKLRLRTIAPVDMTLEERADYSRILANGRRLKKRRLMGMKTGAEYLAANSLSREKPWKVEGITRAEWYRRRTKAETSLAGIKLTIAKTLPVSDQEVLGVVASPPLRSPTQLPASPDLSNFNPILSWLCLRAAYHQQMNRICDQAAVAA